MRPGWMILRMPRTKRQGSYLTQYPVRTGLVLLGPCLYYHFLVMLPILWGYGDTEEAFRKNTKHWMEFLTTGVRKRIEKQKADCWESWSTPGLFDSAPVCQYLFLTAISCSSDGEKSGVLKKRRRWQTIEPKENTIQAFLLGSFHEETGRYSIGAQGTEAFAWKTGAVMRKKIGLQIFGKTRCG